jgi:hypothetical protein
MADEGRGAPPEQTGPEGGAAPSAWRLTFEYEGDVVRLVAQQRVAMVTAPDDAELLARGRAGYWVEVRDAAGKVLYQQVLNNPIRQTYEVFSPDPDEGPRHVDATGSKGVFQAVVPDLPGATEVAVFGQASPRELAESDARELVAGRLGETPPPGGGPAR